MYIVNELIIMILEAFMNSFYANDDETEEETAVLEFENENAFLKFETELNEMIINLTEFDNFGGGAFVSTIRGDYASLLLYFYDEEKDDVIICNKKFVINY